MIRLTVLFALFAAYFAPSAAQGDCAVPRLEIGGQGYVTPGAPNRLRDAASTSAQVGEIPGGATFDVLDGPFCVDGILWWQVSYGGSTAFTAEGSRDSYFVDPVIEAEATAVPTLTAPSLKTVLDVAWSADGKTLVVLDTDGVVTFGADDRDIPAERVLSSPNHGWTQLTLDPAAEDGVYLTGADRIDYAILGADDAPERLANAAWIISFSVAGDGSRYAYLDQDNATQDLFLTINEGGTDTAVSAADLIFYGGDEAIDAVALGPTSSLLALTKNVRFDAGDTGGILVSGGDIPTDFDVLLSGSGYSQRIAFNRDGTFLISISPEGSIDRWYDDGRQKDFIRLRNSLGAEIFDLEINPDDQTFVITERSRDTGRPAARVYSVEAVIELAAYGSEINAESVRGAAYNPDGTLLALGVDDTVRILDAETLDEIAVLE